jgi:hypothetical protein
MDANSNTGGEEAFWDVWRSITSGVVFWLPSIRSKTQPAISKKKKYYLLLMKFTVKLLPFFQKKNI